MKFFIDNCLPPRWAPALSALSECPVEHLRKKFSPGVANIDWIRALSIERGWTIISGDIRITKSLHEREARVESGLTAFFLVKGWDFEFWEKTARIVRWWPKIMEQAKLVQSAAGFLVPVNFKNGKFEQVPLTRKPRA